MIRITFHYDKSGIVTPEASHLKTGRKLTSERINYEEPKVSDIVFRINPRFVVFAVDISWSMEGEKLDSAKTGVIENSRTLFDIYGGNCQIAVITFGTGAEKVCDPTSDLGVIESRVNTIAPSGTTQMDDGINLAMQYVSRAPSGWDRDIVLVTDGMPDTDRTNKTLKAADKARNDGINLCTLGIGSQDVDEDFLKKMTDITLVIEPGDNMASGIATLLRQAEKKH